MTNNEALAYWQAEAHYWREQAVRLSNVLAEIDRATTARHSRALPPEPPIGSEVTTDRGRFTRRADGWECDTDRTVCPNCPCEWSEVVEWGGVTNAAVELPTDQTAPD